MSRARKASASERTKRSTLDVPKRSSSSTASCHYGTADITLLTSRTSRCPAPGTWRSPTWRPRAAGPHPPETSRGGPRSGARASCGAPRQTRGGCRSAAPAAPPGRPHTNNKVPDTFWLVSDRFRERLISLLGCYTSARAAQMSLRSASHTKYPDGGDGFKSRPLDGPTATPAAPSTGNVPTAARAPYSS